MKRFTKSSRHPAVRDLLATSPTSPGVGAAHTAPPTAPVASALEAPAVAEAPAKDRWPRRPQWVNGKIIAGVAGVAVVVVIGANVLGGGSDNPDGPEAVAAVAETTNAAAPTTDSSGTTGESTEVGDECRADRGDQKSGPGVIAAWNHAYYSQRDGAAARALATPNSSVVAADELQKFIDEVPEGTSYCVSTTELNGDVYLVDLSELRPGGVERITQTVTTKKIDGQWFVDVFK